MENYTLHKDDQLPAFWVNKIQDFISALAPNIRLAQPTLQSLRVKADTNAGSGASVDGLWRFITGDQDTTHPGGAAGVYDVHLIASANDIVNTPDPLTDDTDYDLYLKIVASGVIPSGNTPDGNAIAATRKIGECDWDGTNITGFRQLVGATDTTLPLQPQAPSAQGSAFRARGAASQSGVVPIGLFQNADGSSTYLAVYTTGAYASALDVTAGTVLHGALSVAGAATATGGLTVTGGLTSDTLHATGAGTGLDVTNNATIGGTLAVTGNTTIGGTLGVTGAVTFSGGIGITGAVTATTEITARNATSTAVSIGNVGPSAKSGITFQQGEAGSNLYRNAAGALKTDGTFTVGGAGTALSVTNNATVGGTLSVTGAGAAFSVTNNATVGGTLGVTGATSLAAVSATGGYTQSGTGANTFTGASTFSATGTALTVTNTALVGTLNATTIQLGGTSINTAGTLTNVGYINASQTWSGGQTFSAAASFTAAGTALTVTNTLSVGAIAGSPTISGTPNFTGAATGQLAPVDTSTAQLATTAFVLAQAASANPVMNGAVAVGTSTRFARADHVHPSDTSRAPLASPSFTGTPTVTGAAPAVDTNTTQIATTAFVLGQAASANPVMDGAVAVGTSTRFARADHVHPSDTSRAGLTTNTFSGLQTLQAGLTLDAGAGAGTASQTITMTGRNAGAANSAQLQITGAGRFNIVGVVGQRIQLITGSGNALILDDGTNTATLSVPLSLTSSTSPCLTLAKDLHLDAGLGSGGGQTITLTGRIVNTSATDATIAVDSTGNLTYNASSHTFAGGVPTSQTDLALDAQSGTRGQTLTITGRSAGTATAFTLTVGSAGGPTFNIATGKTYVYQVNAATVFQVNATQLTLADGIDIAVNTTTGTKIGTGATQRLGFFGQTPVAQQAATGSVGVGAAGTGTAVLRDTTFTGGIAGTAYTIGDIVRAMKNLGFMA